MVVSNWHISVVWINRWRIESSSLDGEIKKPDRTQPDAFWDQEQWPVFKDFKKTFRLDSPQWGKTSNVLYHIDIYSKVSFIHSIVVSECCCFWMRCRYYVTDTSRTEKSTCWLAGLAHTEISNDLRRIWLQKIIKITNINMERWGVFPSSQQSKKHLDTMYIEIQKQRC